MLSNVTLSAALTTIRFLSFTTERTETTRDYFDSTNHTRQWIITSSHTSKGEKWMQMGDKYRNVRSKWQSREGIIEEAVIVEENANRFFGCSLVNTYPNTLLYLCYKEKSSACCFYGMSWHHCTMLQPLKLTFWHVKRNKNQLYLWSRSDLHTWRVQRMRNLFTVYRV